MSDSHLILIAASGVKSTSNTYEELQTGMSKLKYHLYIKKTYV